ncbi:MAG: glycosyltransferase [Chloroflexi bacterium]|nr:glycosyltransferase [Chloroflexota bacterium]
MRVALVHDYLNQYGGAERVLDALHELYPHAPVYTSLFDPEAMPHRYRTWDIRTSFLQRIPLARRFHRACFLLYPAAFESFDLAGYDLVISDSSAWAKGVITRPETMHICYCHTPMRWAWNYEEYVAREQLGAAVRRILPVAIHFLRKWDTSNARRVDRFIGNSRAVVARIAKYYRREAELIPPPVDTRRIQMEARPGDSLLVVSRLAPYKRVDLAVEACSRMSLPLTVVGDGRDRGRLEALAGATVRFVGRQSDDTVFAAMAGCRAFLFPGEEDFGIAPVEAMAAGRPVVAYASGGALDTVVDGVTGRLFSPQTTEALIAALETLDAERFDPVGIRRHAMGFDTRVFQERIVSYVEQALLAHRQRTAVAHPQSTPV